MEYMLEASEKVWVALEQIFEWICTGKIVEGLVGRLERFVCE